VGHRALTPKEEEPRNVCAHIYGTELSKFGMISLHGDVRVSAGRTVTRTYRDQRLLSRCRLNMMSAILCRVPCRRHFAACFDGIDLYRAY